MADDTGALSLVAVAVVALLISLVFAGSAVSALLVERHRVAAASDAAALAAADVASGLRSGTPCAEARRVAAANSTVLSACVIDGSTATVRVSSIDAPVPIHVDATAGQPSANDSPPTDSSKK